MSKSPGKEHAFAGLIDRDMDPGVVQSLRGRKSALDIGTYDGKALWYLHHRFPSMELHGVDRSPLTYVLHLLAKEGHTQKSLFGLYQAWARSGPSVPSNYIATETTFMERFDIRYDWDIRLEDIGRTYDLVVASNVLHYMCEWEVEGVLAKIRNAMAENGLVYISVKEKPKCGYTNNSWKATHDLMKAAASDWGISLHDVPNGDREEGKGFVITNIY